MNTILLNGHEFHFSKGNLPILIHGEDHAGASLFTVSLVADLYAQGSKILFLSGYPMAKDEFIKQVGEIKDDQVIFLGGNESLNFLKKVQDLEDIGERVILIKNIDLFEQEVFESVINKDKVIISGDIEKVAYRNRLFEKNFRTKIFFSPASFAQIPDLQKWEGYLNGQKEEGKLTLQIQ